MTKDIQHLLLERKSLDGAIIYFIGIGGIGMSALARFFKSKNAEVFGYDRFRSPLCVELEDEGIVIHYEDSLELLRKDADIVIYTPAIPKDMHELNFYQQGNYKLMKRSEILQWITEPTFNICISGTHGKSTITTMVAHILRHSGYGCNAFLGAISVNYNTNFWSSDRAVSVVEADEYDRSFLRLSPDVAVITAMDADHLDIYGTAENVQDAFVQFSKRIRKGGCLINKKGLAKDDVLNADYHFTYSLSDVAADYHIRKLEVENGAYKYDVATPSGILSDVVIHLGGYHNIENSIAAIAISQFLQIDSSAIRAALEEFKGVKRRFEYVIRNEKHVLIDDYAHHPAEIEALLKGVRSLFKEKIVVVFQPHLYSRTKDLADGFAESLDHGDEVIILPIYPARELPMEGVSSEMILSKMRLKDKIVLSKDDMLKKIESEKPALVVMCGAGDIDALVEPVKKILEKNR
ncbi:MAG: UDP-N-acetylmuramate--L-alanine ligase [Pseudopedobacter saltans]|uniref:UDP-N-acetylmuramate--L-alanine ligase n=1 Tax=Pseudopedobacter saltans TaxID=151895 RepID=A0A2W5F3P0_9SPHI|nr:MAG: UDP-N-acetylmuramate--L-alanine ligase [Pseudopedobacter saltans]